eukprot:c9984_g1_i1.p1 GENE.c9984_g1_i1~~c9984_g1_i1.p1  ORF type:complete len:289 (-),score=93.32 c9984_g1_i1:86-952(-)
MMMSTARIVIANKAKFEAKRANIIRGGLSNLQVVTDFDRTVTRAFVDETHTTHCKSCHGVLEICPTLPSSFHTQSAALYEYYHKIEIDPNMTDTDKLPFMIEWYEKAHDLLLSHRVTPTAIKDAVAAANVPLREGFEKLIHTLQHHEVPLLIFSAGVGNVIQEILKQKRIDLADSTHIISNFIEFDEIDASKSRFLEPLVHMYNKNESHVLNTDYTDRVAQRKNVILLGDSLGDVDMANGVSCDEILKIGFLCFHEEEMMTRYTDAFDVVVLDDGSVDIVNQMLSEME